MVQVPPLRSDGCARVCNKCDENQLSPPTYLVEADSKGNLYSWKYKVVWPNRPESGKHSYQTEMDVRMELLKSAVNAQYSPSPAEVMDARTEGSSLCGRSSISSDVQSIAIVNSSMPVRSFKVFVCPGEKSTEYKIRCLTLDQANLDFGRYQKRDLMIYYRLPSLSLVGRRRVIVINALPLELPLIVACRMGTESDDVLHAQVQCYSRNNEDAVVEHLWSTVRLDSQGNLAKYPGHQLGFTDINELLSHYARLAADCDVYNK